MVERTFFGNGTTLLNPSMDPVKEPLKSALFQILAGPYVKGAGVGIQRSLSRSYPRGSADTTIMELIPERPSLLWLWGPTSITAVYMDPLGALEAALSHKGLLLSLPDALHLHRCWVSEGFCWVFTYKP